MRIFLQAHQRNFLYSAYKTTIACSSQKSHQRSWWIVHTQPTKRPLHARPKNPTNEVGGSFILCLQKDCRMPCPKSHQRSWWIVHTQPTKGPLHARPKIPPTKLVDRSYSAYK